MICLDKFQKVLANHFNIDLATLPKVENVLKDLGFKGVLKGDKIELFEESPLKLQTNQHIGSGILGGMINGIEEDEDGNLTFNPNKFLSGFGIGIGGSLAVTRGLKILEAKPEIKQKLASMMKYKAYKTKDKNLKIFKEIDKSVNYGSQMKIIGLENFNEETLLYALARNKRLAINKLDENIAKILGFKYPQDVRRTIQKDEVIHTLREHGENAIKTIQNKQRAVSLNDIINYQNYADNAEIKGLSKDKSNNNVLISAKQLDNDFYVVVEQIRKKQNELSFKNLYFGNGKLDKNIVGHEIKLN